MLTTLDPARIAVGEASVMEVRMLAAEPPSAPPVELDTPLPEDTPPPDVPLLESMIQPPLPDLPPPVFPVDVPPPPPKPQPAKLQPPKARPQQAAATPANSAPSSEPATTEGPPQTLSLQQVVYLVPPNPIYPVRSRRAGEHGTVVVRAYVDGSGVPAQVTIDRSSGHPALDEAAVSAMRAARIRTTGRPVWIVGPIGFQLQR